MSAGIYHIIEENVKEVAASFNITDGSTIRQMINEELKKKMKEKGRELVDTLNIMGGDVQEAAKEGLLEGIMSSHPYLQGEFWSVMLKIIDGYGKNKFVDARNEFAVEMCQRMAVAGDDHQTREVLKDYVKNRSWGNDVTI